MKIYTKTGDKGTTSLIGGKRTEKFDLQIEVIGLIDELNSSLGLTIALIDNTKLLDTKDCLVKIQNTLFNIGGEIAASHNKELEKAFKYKLKESDVVFIEKEIDKYSIKLSPLTQFILPGGTVVSSLLHLARSKTRTAERSLVKLSHEIIIDKVILEYINRLSDLLFVYARYVNKVENREDITWQKQ